MTPSLYCEPAEKGLIVLNQGLVGENQRNRRVLQRFFRVRVQGHHGDDDAPMVGLIANSSGG